MSMNFPGADKFMNRLFRRADNVVWDLMSGKIGIRTSEGIATLSEDGRVHINLMDDFGLALPAFAQSTPVDQINVGDIIMTGKADAVRFVVDVIEAAPTKTRGKSVAATKTTTGTPPAVSTDVVKKFRTITLDGQETTWLPPKTTVLGLDSGVMVLRSLVSLLPNGNQGLGQMQNMLMPLMMMGGTDDADMERMMPMLLMSQTGAMGDSNGMGNMFQTMMMMKMLGGGKSGSNPFGLPNGKGNSNPTFR